MCSPQTRSAVKCGVMGGGGEGWTTLPLLLIFLKKGGGVLPPCFLKKRGMAHPSILSPQDGREEGPLLPILLIFPRKWRNVFTLLLIFQKKGEGFTPPPRSYLPKEVGWGER